MNTNPYYALLENVPAPKVGQIKQLNPDTAESMNEMFKDEDYRVHWQRCAQA